MTTYDTFYTPCGEGFYSLPGELPAPGVFDSLEAVQRAHTGHYFDRGWMRAMGDRRAVLRHGFARVCEQTAPYADGLPAYAVTYWRRTDKPIGADGAVTCRHVTREAANRCADIAARDGFVRCVCGVSSASDPAAHDDACPVSRLGGAL